MDRRGFEPLTSTLQAWRSSSLIYRPFPALVRGRLKNLFSGFPPVRLGLGTADPAVVPVTQIEFNSSSYDIQLRSCQKGNRIQQMSSTALKCRPLLCNSFGSPPIGYCGDLSNVFAVLGASRFCEKSGYCSARTTTSARSLCARRLDRESS